MDGLKKALLSTASRIAEEVGLPEIKTREDVGGKVTPKLGKAGRPYRRIIKYERVGPLHRQVGIKWLHGECWPIMQTFFKHRFLHATKGWREYTGGPLMRMPYAPPALNPAAAFYGRR